MTEETQPAIEAMLETMAEIMVIVDTWIVLDYDVRNGVKTAEEIRDEFSKFLVPIAARGIGLMETFPEIGAYVTRARLDIDKDREYLLGSDQTPNE